jgi:DNA-binding NarL/FixJ family response regulator
MPPFSILVFDSHPALLGALIQHIEAHHAESLAIAGAAFRQSDALVLAAATSPQIVLLGTSGPMQEAARLIEHLHRLLPSAIVVLMTHLGMAGYAQAALDIGADMFVDKDHLNTRLVPAIMQIARDRNIALR